MQRRAAYFGFGAVAGVVAGTGYWRAYQQVKLGESSVEALEQPLFKYGRPELPFSSRTYTSHSVLYDHARKVPLWSAEVITPHNVSGSAKRRHSQFQPDPAVPARFSSTNADYKKSGWSRGHMTPAADCRHCQEAMDESHYLTNIVPQDFNNNSGFWNRLEMFCRDLTKKYSAVHVISGPLYLPSDYGGKKYVKYQVIGAGNVAVPTHLYKVILAEVDSSDPTDPSSRPPPSLGVFVVPNKPLGDEDLSTFQTTLHDLETLTGISFHSKLDRSKVGDLCKTDGCELMTALELKQFVFSLRLQSAKSEQQIEKILGEARAEGLETDTGISQKATQRINELRKI